MGHAIYMVVVNVLDGGRSPVWFRNGHAVDGRVLTRSRIIISKKIFRKNPLCRRHGFRLTYRRSP